MGEGTGGRQCSAFPTWGPEEEQGLSSGHKVYWPGAREEESPSLQRLWGLSGLSAALAPLLMAL